MGRSEGGREEGGGRDLSLCRLGPFNRKLVKKRTQAALETMPSDNEEQPVDAKTIAELTEQV